MVTNSFVDRAEIDDLALRVRGEVLQPGDPAYEDARNGAETWPTVIIRCVDPEDIIAAVNFARESGQTLSFRYGRETADEPVIDQGIVIDLSSLRPSDRRQEQQRSRDDGAVVADAPFGAAASLWSQQRVRPQV